MEAVIVLVISNTHWHIQQLDFDTVFRLTEIRQVADLISEKCVNDLQ